MKSKFILEVPIGFSAEFSFDRGPAWLRILAQTPFFDRYAYSIAMRRGFAELWPDFKDSKLDEDFEIEGWVIHKKPKNDLERWIEGSFALLGQGKKNRLIQFLYKNRSIPIGRSHALFWSVLPQITFTHYGAQLKRRHRIHRYNGTYKDYKKALHGERFDFSE